MPRKKSTDTPEVKALRKLLLSLGLSAFTVNHLVKQADGRIADLSAKACEVEMYIASHPEVKSPASYAATTLINFVAELESKAQQTIVERPAVAQQTAPATMELWGYDD